MGRSTIALVWLGGIVLTALIYVAGPGHFIFAVTSALSQAEWAVGNAVAYLSWRAFDLVRAAAIALFVVYLVLGILASQRGLGRGGMVGISVLFVVLIALGGYESRFCWFAALLVAGAGAFNMTQRLLGSAPPSWRPGHFRPGGESRSRP